MLDEDATAIRIFTPEPDVTYPLARWATCYGDRLMPVVLANGREALVSDLVKRYQAGDPSAVVRLDLIYP